MLDDKRIHRQTLNGSKEDRKETLPTLEREPGQDRELSFPQKECVKTAIIHDWLNGMRGGEIVFEAILDLYPEADIFTLIYEPRKLSPRLREKLAHRKVTVSWLNFLRFTRKNYRQLLPVLPLAIRGLDVYGYDLIISSSHCVAKGVKKHPKAKHISYIHAPMRYMWDRFDDYFGEGRIHFALRWVAILLRPLLQAWDKRTAQVDRIDVLLANSNFIGTQIKKNYGRDATTLYPFAELSRFQRDRKPGNFYLMVGAFAPYKRTDLAIEAFARLGLPLKIVGQGQDGARLIELKTKLKAQNIEFIRKPSNEQIERLYAECKAFIFPGTEDFGITPLEAMASGAPVIAYGDGGACETVSPKSGLLFRPQTVQALSEAVMEIESGRKYFSPQECRNRAAFFNLQRFQTELREKITQMTEK